MARLDDTRHLQTLILLVSIMDISPGAFLSIEHKPEHTSSNYRHPLQASKNADSSLRRILIPNEGFELDDRLKESHSNRRRRDVRLSSLSDSGASGRGGHSRRHSSDPSSQHRLYRSFFKRLEAVNATKVTKAEFAKIYVEPNLLPRYECQAGKWACPKPNKRKRVLCIDESQVCDLHLDCPSGDDEDPLFCASFRENKLLKEQISVLQESIKLLQASSEKLRGDNSYHECKIGNLDSKIVHHYHKDDTVYVGGGYLKSCARGLT